MGSVSVRFGDWDPARQQELLNMVVSGPEGVAQFFAAVSELDIRDFQVLDILASGHQIAVEVLIDYTTPAGGHLRDEEVHLRALDDHQQVTRLRHYVDTAKHIAAFAGEDTTA